MTAPLLHPVVPAASVRQEIAAPATCAKNAQVRTQEDIYIDLNFLDANKIAGETSYRLSTDAWR